LHYKEVVLQVICTTLHRGTYGTCTWTYQGGPDDPDLLFIQRSKGLRLHAGQPGFPGGVIEAADQGPVAAALREAAEEVGVDPHGVDVLGTLAELFIPPTGFQVIPVLAWWRQPCAVSPVDQGEVAAVERISVSELAEPSARLMMHRPPGNRPARVPGQGHADLGNDRSPGGPAARTRRMGAPVGRQHGREPVISPG